MPLLAQTNSFGKSDPAARSLLDQMTRKFKNHPTIFANFSLRVSNGEGKELASETGSLQIKGDKYRIITADQQIYSDGKTIWTYNIPDREIQITNYDPGSDILTPQKMFTDFYDSSFLYKLNEDIKQGGKTLQEIELTPLDKSKPFFKMLLRIDKATKDLLSVTVFEKNGNRYLYRITALDTGLDHETQVFAVTFSTEDMKEGTGAFLARRKPQFTGR